MRSVSVDRHRVRRPVVEPARRRRQRRCGGPALDLGQDDPAGATAGARSSDHDAFDLADRHGVRRPVVELRRLRGPVPSDLLRVLERPPVREVRRDPRRPERVAARRGGQPRRRRRRPPLDHRQDDAPLQRPSCQPVPRRLHALEERRLRLFEFGRLDVLVQCLRCPVVSRDVMPLPALLV